MLSPSTTSNSYVFICDSNSSTCGIPILLMGFCLSTAIILPSRIWLSLFTASYFLARASTMSALRLACYPSRDMRRFSKAQKRASIHVSVISTPLLSSSTLGEDYIFLGSNLTPPLPGDPFIKFPYSTLLNTPALVAQFRPTACCFGGYSGS